MSHEKLCTIQYNKAVEFISAILKYKTTQIRQSNWNTPEFQKDAATEIMDHTPNLKVKEWLQYVDDNISPFLRNDILFITDDVYGIINVCYHLVLIEDIMEPLDLIESLKSLDTSTMIEIAYKYYELDAPLNDEELLRIRLTETFSSEVANSFLQFKNHPIEFRNKVIEILLIFYKQFYEPFEKMVYSYMEERMLLHNSLFNKDHVYFINTVGMGDYSKAIELHENLIVYMSFYIDVGIIYFTFESTLVMCCGQTVEFRFENRKNRDEYKALFKALADDKRIEIIKLTSERPWYNKELADHFKLTSATLSYHLNLLLDLGILNFEPSIVNNRYYYTTNKNNLRELFNIALEDLLE